MNTPARRYTLIEWALSATAITLVVAVMLTMDTPARDYVEAKASNASASDLRSTVPEPLTRMTRAAWRICMDHQPLAGFAGVACVLVLFMRRMR